MESLSPLLQRSVLLLYYLVLGTLALYGVHRLWLVWVYVRTRHLAPKPPPDPARWPLVTVQLPLYNEVYVAGRLIDAVCRLDYPRQLLEIQVLDDSTDSTSARVAQRVHRYRRQGFNIRHLHRRQRSGFKAGALAAGLRRARGELVAVFDADFVPQPDFLKVTVPYFGEANVGMVQARWDHLNRDYSLLTKVEALMLDGHFLIEHTARHRSGCLFNFNGTAGIWRRQAIEEAGGWQHDTLTEDLDLSYRAQLAGWRFLYLPGVVVPSELPVDIHGFKSQQYRWAKGSIQTGRKLLHRVLRAPVSWRAKLEAFVHLTANANYLLMILLSLLIFPAMVLRYGASSWQLLMVDLPLFVAATVSVLVFYLMSQRAAGRGLWQQSLVLPALMAVGIGLSVNNTRAVVSGLLTRGGAFIRTPKYRIDRPKQRWQDKRYRALKSRSYPVEGLLAGYFVSCFALASHDGMWLSLPFLYLFLRGYSYIFVLSLAPSAAGTTPAKTDLGSR